MDGRTDERSYCIGGITSGVVSASEAADSHACLRPRAAAPPSSRRVSTPAHTRTRRSQQRPSPDRHHMHTCTHAGTHTARTDVRTGRQQHSVWQSRPRRRLRRRAELSAFELSHQHAAPSRTHAHTDGLDRRQCTHPHQQACRHDATTHTHLPAAAKLPRHKTPRPAPSCRTGPLCPFAPPLALGDLEASPPSVAIATDHHWSLIPRPDSPPAPQSR
ncbi:unnamed protein product [Protopolystoma xenopodis]|uniref:Uncharacterized protein n=1 Tax=Protopolystoma xenopodis TaxID=117903 RepID=A0A448XCI9_9PLAT|nr:unnamed protein product [Protopolystoma xenopodis]